MNVEPSSEGRTYDKAIKVHVDFDLSTGTRTANLRTTTEIINSWPAIDGNAQSVGAWFKGSEGINPMTSFTIADANGKFHYLYGARVEGTDWQYISVPVPQNIPHPITVQRIALYETGAARQYLQDVLVDDVTAVIAPTVTAPSVEVYYDDAVSEAGSTEGMPLRIAVVSNAQFVSENPSSSQVAAARQVLQEALPQSPDHVIILGDWVDEGEPADIALARQIIDEEFAGSEVRWTDVEGTRIITLDSNPYNISHNPKQVKFLEQQLDDAKVNHSITGVVLALHHPTQDNITGASALHDAQDARFIEDQMAEVYAAGKSAIVLNAGVGAFDTYQVDGVVHVINGNAGKSPNSTPDRGGFSGWTMIGIDQANGLWQEATGEWVNVEIKPFVDDLTITGPSSVAAGETIDLDGTVTEGSRQVPAQWPVSYKWDAGDGVWVGDAATAPDFAVVALDPATGELTALDRVFADGEVTARTDKYAMLEGSEIVTVTVELTVNQVTETHEVAVTVPNGEWNPSANASERNSCSANAANNSSGNCQSNGGNNGKAKGQNK